MSSYLIKLTPVGKFFFGGDMTFSVGVHERPKNGGKMTEEEQKQLEYNTRYSSYIIKSEKFPQQTSLLGMLRFLLLRNSHDLFDVDKNIIKEGKREEIKNLIGEKGFTSSDNDDRKEENPENSFGKIKKISSCFLMKGYKDKDEKIPNIVTKLPMDYDLKKIDVSATSSLSYNDNQIYLSKVVSGEKENGDEVLYSAKDGISTRFGNGKETYENSDIFIEDERIGINRDIQTGHTENNALFKQVNYRLAAGFCFAFYAEIDIANEIIKDYSNQVVSLGADNSQFVVQISPAVFQQPTIPPSNVTTKGCYGKIVLTSPALIDKDTVKQADFAIAETIPFKFMQTTIDLKSYHRLSGSIQHSKKTFLFQTGSVFYFRLSDGFESFKSGLEKRKDFQQIGYNQYQTVCYNND